MFQVLDLFSGIGGFSLGLQRSGGFKTVAFCEIEPFCRRVLAKHWPEVPCYDDIRTLTAERLQADGIVPDVLCGGFPCQDISTAGKGVGIEGERSGLWSEYARLVGELRPRYVVVENVAALLFNGMDTVLGDLASIGYDAEWHCIPASAIGAPHRRDRLWIVAYPKGERYGDRGEERDIYEANGRSDRPSGAITCGTSQSAENMAYADKSEHGTPWPHQDKNRATNWPVTSGSPLSDANSKPQGRLTIAWQECSQWSAEPDVGRVADGVPARVDRLRGLGNAVIPQIPEMIGRAIIAADSHINA